MSSIHNNRRDATTLDQLLCYAALGMVVTPCYEIGPAGRVTHREESRARIRRYRTRLVLNGGSHTIAEWLALCERHGRRCLACGAVGVMLTEDHIVPVSRGGSDDIGNIQPLCRPCNGRKGSRTIDYR